MDATHLVGNEDHWEVDSAQPSTARLKLLREWKGTGEEQHSHRVFGDHLHIPSPKQTPEYVPGCGRATVRPNRPKDQSPPGYFFF